MKLPDLPTKPASIILRVVMGAIFVTHGFARLYYGSVPDFGEYLSSQGFPFGVLFAWLVTFGEMLCGTMMAIGYKVRYCVIFHAVVVLFGLFLIHIPQGWFVVGHGSGGSEYSLLILSVLLFIYSKNSR